MSLFIRSATVLLAVCLFTACTNSNSSTTNKSGVTRLNTEAILADKTTSDKEKAEKLALAGEQLLSPNGFMYSETLFEQALELDSTNLRAGLYKNIISTAVLMKGALGRVKTLASRDPEATTLYTKALAQLPDSNLRGYLLDGSDDIKTEKDVQSLADKVVETQGQLREFLKKNKDMEMVLNVPDWVAHKLYAEYLKNCNTYVNEKGVYEMFGCDASALQVKINRADVETMQQAAAGGQIYAIGGTAYDLTGGFDFYLKHKGTKVTKKAASKELSKVEEFGKLRRADGFKLIESLGIDGVAGVRWATEMQAQICPAGNVRKDSRRGYAFRDGLCVPTYTKSGKAVAEILKLVECGLMGQVVALDLGNDSDGNPVSTRAKPNAFLDNPVADIKTLRPVFNKCDKLTSISDDSAGGVAVDHDANEIISSFSKCSIQEQYPNWTN